MTTGPRLHLWEVVVDCAEPAVLAALYAGLCGCEPHRFDDEWYWIEPASRGGGVADAGGPRIAFQRVPEPKVGKVRLHLDLGTDDLEGAVRRAVSLGAGRLGDPVTDAAGSFVVLADPEGHEFCVVTE